MTDSRPQQLVRRFKRKGWDSSPYESLVEFLRGDEDELWEFVSLYIDECDEGRPFFEDALQFLSESRFSEAISQSVRKLSSRRRRKNNGTTAAEAVILQASLQFPHLLEPHLVELWELRPNASSYCAMWPWRAAGPDERHPPACRTLCAEQVAGSAA